jgi:hypothetical protein
MTEAEEGQRQSLLHSNVVEMTEVWPIIHMIRAVSQRNLFKLFTAEELLRI